MERGGFERVVRHQGGRGQIEEIVPWRKKKKLSGFAVQKNLFQMSCGIKVPLEKSATRDWLAQPHSSFDGSFFPFFLFAEIMFWPCQNPDSTFRFLGLQVGN